MLYIVQIFLFTPLLLALVSNNVMYAIFFIISLYWITLLN